MAKHLGRPIFSECGEQFLDLRTGTRVDPVENRFAQRLTVFIDRDAVTAHHAGSDACDLLWSNAGLFHESAADFAKIGPPDLGIHLKIIGLRILHCVRYSKTCNRAECSVNQYAF